MTVPRVVRGCRACGFRLALGAPAIFHELGGDSVGTRGHAIFAERLARFAADVDDPAVHAVAARAGADVTAGVHGRPGVGRGTVARALAAAGVSVAEDGDVDVHVVAEVVKPEDRVAIAESGGPSLVVLNKADLVTGARALCARYRALTGVPTVPMAAHLADLQIDDELLCVPTSGEPSQRVLPARSGVAGVVAALAPLLAEARYRRVRSACAALETIAATGDEEVAAFLRDDDTVIACMAAAVDVVQTAGITVDPSDDPAAHLRRAAHWQRYRCGPVNAVHTACASDIARGSLRLWRRAGS